MLQACGSPRLYQMVRQLAEAAELYHRALLPVVARDEEMEREHFEMLSAILDGDADRAVAILTLHLERTRDVMLPPLQLIEDEPKRIERLADTAAATIAPIAAIAL